MERFFVTNRFSMRLITLVVLALSTSVFLFTGCDKESLTQAEPTPETNGLNVPELLTDKDDPENDKVNKVLYVFAHAVKDLSTDSEILALLKGEMKKDKKGYGVSLRRLAAENERFGTQLAVKLEKYLDHPHLAGLKAEMQEKTGQALIEQLSAALLCREKVYEPVIHTLQQETELSFRNQDVVVAIGQEVNDNDEILAYRNGSSTPFLLSEAAALASNDLIIFVGPGDIPENSTGLSGSGEITAPNSTASMVEFRNDIDIDVDQHQIKAGHRYEDDNYSEVSSWAVFFFPSVTNPIGSSDWQDFKSRSIHKNNIDASTIFINPLNGFHIGENPFLDGVFVFFGTWEYDWYASLKFIQNPCSSNHHHQTNVRMKFSHEWYFIDCGRANQLWPTAGTNRTFENEKCMFKLRRWM
ncbi:MAG: hypothetical protein IAE84_15980 [Saprospiraceae bacterium]|nr:hypothetical protein [Saprospiraceae bacterium]